MIAAEQQRKDAIPEKSDKITAGESTLGEKPGVYIKTTYDMKKNQEPTASKSVEEKRARTFTSVNPRAT